MSYQELDHSNLINVKYNSCLCFSTTVVVANICLWCTHVSPLPQQHFLFKLLLQSKKVYKRINWNLVIVNVINIKSLKWLENEAKKVFECIFIVLWNGRILLKNGFFQARITRNCCIRYTYLEGFIHHWINRKNFIHVINNAWTD